ncbi:MAG: hypothetical protein REI96_13270, partial [Flavobacterium nitrogenifigens]
MKQAFLIYFFLIPIISFSQTNGAITIDWQNKKEINYGESKIIIPYFLGTSFRFDITKKSIALLQNLNQSGISNGSSVQI